MEHTRSPSKGRAELTFALHDAITLDEAERLRNSIATLIETGSLNIRNGSVLLHFDNEGILQTVELKFIRFKRKGLNAIRQEKTRVMQPTP